VSSTTQPTDFEDLFTDLQNRLRITTNVTTTETLAKRYINMGLHDMHIGFSENMPWAERHAQLITQKPYTTGTVLAVQGSTTLTGTTTAWKSDNEHGFDNVRPGGKFVIAGGTDVYEVSSVTSDTVVVLTSNFAGGSRETGDITAFASAAGSTVTVTSAAHGLLANMVVGIDGTTSYNGDFTINSVTTDTFNITDTFVADDATGTWASGSLSGASYQYFEDEYALDSTFLRPIDQQSFADNMSIDLIGRTEFRRRYPQNRITGRPHVATITDHPFSGSTTPVRKIRFHRPTDKGYLIQYSFITSNLAVTSSGSEQASLSSDSDEPIIPIRYRAAIVLWALYHYYRDLKDDVRSQEAKLEYAGLMTRLAGDSEIGQARPQIRPRIQGYSRRAKRPWGGRGGRRFSTEDDRFARLED